MVAAEPVNNRGTVGNELKITEVLSIRAYAPAAEVIHCASVFEP